MRLAVSLPVRNGEQLHRQVRDVSDPSSATYRHYLTPDQYAAKYAPAEADWAQSRGLSIERTFPNRLVLELAGTADLVEKAILGQLPADEALKTQSEFAALHAPSRSRLAPDVAPPKASIGRGEVGELSLMISP